MEVLARRHAVQRVWFARRLHGLCNLPKPRAFPRWGQMLPVRAREHTFFHGRIVQCLHNLRRHRSEPESPLRACSCGAHQHAPARHEVYHVLPRRLRSKVRPLQETSALSLLVVLDREDSETQMFDRQQPLLLLPVLLRNSPAADSMRTSATPEGEAWGTWTYDSDDSSATHTWEEPSIAQTLTPAITTTSTKTNARRAGGKTRTTSAMTIG